jgi:hypothetical protein
MKKENSPTKKICVYGYEYTLVATNIRGNDFPQPCFMGHQGYALQSVKKLNSK